MQLFSLEFEGSFHRSKLAQISLKSKHQKKGWVLLVRGRRLGKRGWVAWVKWHKTEISDLLSCCYGRQDNNSLWVSLNSLWCEHKYVPYLKAHSLHQNCATDSSNGISNLKSSYRVCSAMRKSLSHIWETEFDGQQNISLTMPSKISINNFTSLNEIFPRWRVISALLCFYNRQTTVLKLIDLYDYSAEMHAYCTCLDSNHSAFSAVDGKQFHSKMMHFPSF